MIGGNPMDYFQAGMAGGQVRSPVSGVGNAIRGVLEQGRKMGLINAQAGSNLATGLATAGYKNQLATNRATAAGAQPEPRIFRDESTGKTLVENSTYDENTGTWIKKVSPASTSMIEFATSQGGDGGQADLTNALQQILAELQQD